MELIWKENDEIILQLAFEIWGFILSAPGLSWDAVLKITKIGL